MKKYFQGKTVLVTGVAGFLGSHLLDELLDAGANVIGVDNLLTGRLKNLADHLDVKSLKTKSSNFTLIKADVSQSAEKYLDKNVKVDVIFHMASPASPPKYQAAPIETYLVNSLGTHYLLQFLKHNNPEGRFMYASTSEVYGDPEVHPQKEEYWGHVNPNGIRSCYDEAKRLGETICGVFYRDFAVDARIFRIFNTYGPRINPEDGRVIPAFVSQALKNEAMTIFGDGSQTRSYCYVSDLVDGILHYAASDGLAGETINIGNPEEFTVKETAEIISKLIDDKAEPKMEFLELPKDDPVRRKPDISKAKKLLNFEPKVKFESGLEKTIEYFKQHEL